MCFKRLKHLRLGTKMYTRSFSENLILSRRVTGIGHKEIKL